MPDYRYRGARSAVLLHEQQIRLFLETWKKAKSSGVVLPVVDDPDYASLDAILGHVLRWSGKYLTWICEQFGLPDPALRPVPEIHDLAAEAAGYADHVLQGWESPLRDIPEERFFKEIYPAPWGIPYCIDAMLEHAVMHPVKHRFQLGEWMGEEDPK